MRWKPQLLAVLILTVLGLSACGQAKLPEVVDTPSISVSRDGEVTAYQIGVFDKDYYQISELTAMAVEEAAAYNTEHTSGTEMLVRIEKVESLGDGSGKVVVNSIYRDAEVYTDYNETPFFYGTVAEAVTAGVDLDGVLKALQDDTILSTAELKLQSDRHIIVTTEQVRIYSPYKVTHVTDNVVMAEDGSVDATQADGNVIVLMSK